MKLILTLFLLVNILNAKKDFYYSFIDSSGEQISEQRKQSITDGFDILQNARNLARDDKIDEAYSLVKDFKEKNKIKVLTSDIMILYAELALKKQTKRLILEASTELESAINSSLINQNDLSKAYMLLVELKLEINKIEDAKYFSQVIIDNFDDELTKTYGKISMAKVYKYQKDYTKAIKYLYEILTVTKDKNVATLVADELFDVYVLDGKLDKANELITQVLKTNIEFYANDSYLANKKINRLIKAGMPEHAAEILRELLKRTTKDESIEDFKYKLANTYMLMYDKTNYYLEKAKDLYKDIINDYPQGIHAKNAKMFIDEILMRQGFLTPSSVAAKYPDVEAMQQKALLQELMNDKNDKKFEMILKAERVYRKVSNEIVKRFGYNNIDEIFDEVNMDLIKDYLAQGKCFELNDILKTSRSETLEKLIQDETVKFNFFECLVEVPYERAYLQIKETFNKTRDANIYLYLERMAFSLGLINEALDFSSKVEMVDDKNVLAKEFIYRYQINKTKDDATAMEKFFIYASENPEYIKLNESNPVIIDFYHDYYLYLIKNEEKKQADDILMKLYNKQKDLKAFIYSPFVETELSRLEKEKDNYQQAVDYLLESIPNTRKIKPNDEVKIYYDILNLYDNLGNKDKKAEYILKCKEVKDTTDSLYKKMCDEM
ncbi:MAG: tol-pal system YbgF family protein [Arcobacter sp.]|uniref:tetratricopeptide repeat protein n=1 Tax=Arcobacter sp. TaxID=1872629 RepID=UPI003D06833F